MRDAMKSILRQTLIRYIDGVHGNSPQDEVESDKSVILLRRLLDHEPEVEKLLRATSSAESN